MHVKPSPYRCHLFVCTNNRHDERKSCADGGTNLRLKELLKEEINKRGWKGVVRVSDSGCLGLCDAGPNVLLYPQQIWFSGVSGQDVPAILETVSRQLADPL